MSYGGGSRSAAIREFHAGGLKSASERSNRRTVRSQHAGSAFQALYGWQGCLKPEPDPVVPSATTRERRESAHSWNIIDFSRLWLNVGRPVPPPNTCPLAGGGVDRTAHLDGRVVRVRVDPQGDRDLAAGDLVQQPEQMVMTRFNRWLSSSSFACRFFEELRGGSSIAIASASSTVPDFAGLG